MITSQQLDGIAARLGSVSSAGSSAGYVAEMWRLALKHADIQDENVPRSPTCDAIPYVPIDPATVGVELGQQSRVLDIGCCGGYGAFDFSRRRDRNQLEIPAIDCVDVDVTSIAIGRELAAIWGEGRRVSFVMADANQLPCRSGSYDLVIARLLLPYVRIDTVLKEIHRVLKPGGVVMFQLHAWPYYLNRLIDSWRSPKRMVYYGRPILSGLWLAMTGHQPRSSWFSECFLSIDTLVRIADPRKLHCVWRGGMSWKPMAAFRRRL